MREERTVASGGWPSFRGEGSSIPAKSCFSYSRIELGSLVGLRDVDAKGKPVGQSFAGQLGRMRKLAVRPTPAHRTRLRFLSQASILTTKLNLPSTIGARGQQIYSTLVRNHTYQGSRFDVAVAAAMFAATREAGISRRGQEFADTAGVPYGKMMRYYKKAASSLGLRIDQPDAHRLISRAASDLGVPAAARLAVQIHEEALSSDPQIFAGRNPMAGGGAALYLACRTLKLQVNSHDVNEKVVAQASGLTEATVRNTVRIMHELPALRERYAFPRPRLR